jgi:hypothetical protein
MKKNPLEKILLHIEDARDKITQALEHTANARSIALNQNNLELSQELKIAYQLLKSTLED